MSEHIIALANQKGGVGKTTSCVNLAAALVAFKHTVLLLDLDPQGNATMGSGVDKNKAVASMTDVLQETTDIQTAMITTQGGYFLLPANSDLTAAEVGLIHKPNQAYTLKHALEKITGQFEYILIDCPPSLNTLTLNALVAAHSVIIPMQCEYYALEGLSSLLDTIEQIRETLNPHLKIEGLLRTMYDPRNRLSSDVSAQLISHFGNKVYQTVIPRNIRLAEAPSHGLPIFMYDKLSRGSEAYLSLAKELQTAKKREARLNDKTQSSRSDVNKEYV